MRIIKQEHITRNDIQTNKDVLYIFGDNLKRYGFGGQAKEMRGEPNSFGFATKRKPEHGTKDCYFYDSDPDCFSVVVSETERLIKAIKGNFDLVVIPSSGIGTGLAQLTENAPKMLNFISTILDSLDLLCITDYHSIREGFAKDRFKFIHNKISYILGKNIQISKIHFGYDLHLFLNLFDVYDTYNYNGTFIPIETDNKNMYSVKLEFKEI